MVRQDSRVRQDLAMVWQDLARVRQDLAGSGKPLAGLRQARKASGTGVRPGLEGGPKTTFSRNARNGFPRLRGALGGPGGPKSTPLGGPTAP